MAVEVYLLNVTMIRYKLGFLGKRKQEVDKKQKKIQNRCSDIGPGPDNPNPVCPGAICLNGKLPTQDSCSGGPLPGWKVVNIVPPGQMQGATATLFGDGPYHLPWVMPSAHHPRRPYIGNKCH